MSAASKACQQGAHADIALTLNDLDGALDVELEESVLQPLRSRRVACTRSCLRESVRVRGGRAGREGGRESFRHEGRNLLDANSRLMRASPVAPCACAEAGRSTRSIVPHNSLGRSEEVPHRCASNPPAHRTSSREYCSVCSAFREP